MKKFSFFRKVGLMATLAATAVFISCTEDDTPVAEEPPVASFQFEVNESNFLEVTFSNFSENAVSYAWDFGDQSGTSTEESPSYTYAEPGTYTVTLTATGADETTNSQDKDVTVSDPDSQLTLLAGLTSKEWIVQREGTVLYVGPSQTAYDGGWWSLSENHAARACVFDDVYTFERSGNFGKNTAGTFFMDARANGGWNDDVTGGEGCVDEANDAGAFTDSETSGDYSALANGGNYTYEYNTSTNDITITGAGAYIALPKVANGGDVGTQAALPGLITFKVVKLVEGDVADSLHLHHNPDGGDGFWTFKLVSYHDSNNIPEFDPVAAFSSSADGLTYTFTNESVLASSYSWDFGDGGTSTEENPMHTYAAAGSYDVTLTVMDDAGTSAMVTNTVNAVASVLEPATMGHNFANAEGADLLTKIDNGASTITLGAADPAGGEGLVGQFDRIATDWQEAIISMDPQQNFLLKNMNTMSIDVYLPSTNDYTGTLSQGLVIGFGDQTEGGDWWTYQAQWTADDLALDQWHTLTFDLTTPTSGSTDDATARTDLDMLFLGFGGGGHSTPGVFYIRNLELKKVE